MERLTDREKEVLALIKDDPMISQEELAARLRITRSATAVHISNLLRKGAILGRGYYFAEPAGVLLVGGLGLEIEAGRAAGRGEVKVGFGGLAYRLARRLAQLEVAVGVLGVVGADRWGETILQELEAAGVGTGHVLISPHHPTPKWVRCHGPGGLEVADDEAMGMLNRHYVASRENVINRMRVVAVDAGVAAEAAEEACRVAGQGGVTAVQLLAGAGRRPVAPGSVAICLEAPPGAAGGDPARAAVEAARSLVAAGAKAGLCRAEGGVAMVDVDGERFTGGVPGRSGDGEDLVVGVLYGLARGYQLRQAVRIGLASPAKYQPA